jgi:hypothetical protein
MSNRVESSVAREPHSLERTVGREAPMVITPSALRRFVKWILSGGRQT